MIIRIFGWAAILAIGLQLGGCLNDYGPVTTTQFQIPSTPSHRICRPGTILRSSSSAKMR